MKKARLLVFLSIVKKECQENIKPYPEGREPLLTSPKNNYYNSRHLKCLGDQSQRRRPRLHYLDGFLMIASWAMWAPRTMAGLGEQAPTVASEAERERGGTGRGSGILCHPPRHRGPLNEWFSAQSLNVHTAGAEGPSTIPSRCTMSDTCVLRGGTPRARHHGHEDRQRSVGGPSGAPPTRSVRRTCQMRTCSSQALKTNKFSWKTWKPGGIWAEGQGWQIMAHPLAYT